MGKPFLAGVVVALLWAVAAAYSIQADSLKPAQNFHNQSYKSVASNEARQSLN